MKLSNALLISGIAGTMISCRGSSQKQPIPELEKIPGKDPRNVIFILSDDHRYDFMGFTGKVPGLETPNMDRMAARGAHIRNAFVSTSLCSPSRASILTGQYAHTHRIVDNSAPAPGDNVYFPEHLQKAGYQTAFIGKWHMGHTDFEPRKGFDRWVSFKGQGTYYGVELNVDGEVIDYPDSVYTTRLLTGYALDFLEERDPRKPFFLYLSHKAVHAMFKPARRDLGKYENMKIRYPETMDLTATGEYKKYDIPEWVKEQRYSWHGVDYMYHGQLSFEEFYKRYCETLLGVDRSIGRVMDYLSDEGIEQTTMVIYMGDNGFSFGEHGLIDKRNSFEESIRVPMLACCPEIIEGNTVITEMIQNIDIAPTILEMAGLQPPENMQGMSFLPVLERRDVAWRDRIYYEYYWEYYFPQTPTTFAVRTDRYKYVFHHGIWDANEFYDLQEDPIEKFNLIRSPEHQEMIKSLRDGIWEWLESTDGMSIPLKRIGAPRGDYRFKGYY